MNVTYVNTEQANPTVLITIKKNMHDGLKIPCDKCSYEASMTTVMKRHEGIKQCDYVCP